MIKYQTQFMSLRAKTLYTVTIYDDDYSGTPIQLTAGAQPFETEEETDEDMFLPVRTQSGYIRIVDDGTVDWRDIIPTTDTDRPVRLTHMEGSTEVIDWAGFMQAQNFGAQLYELPHEREFPIQCPLTVMSCEDVDTDVKDIHNFAYLLRHCLECIPATARPSQIVVQGGADAKAWLLTRVDWKDFIDEDKEHEPKAKYDRAAMLEDMCRFWGWTARVKGMTLYLTCADDIDEANALVLSYSDLTDLAYDDDDAGTIETMYTDLTVGDIFASTDNWDYQQRGANKAIVKVDTSSADTLVDLFDNDLVKDMNRADWYEGTIESDGDDYWHYTKDITSVSRYDLGAMCVANASFNILSKGNGAAAGYGYSEVGNVIHFAKTYTGNVFLTLITKYEHCFSDGFLRLFADTYRKGEKYEEGQYFAGNPAMKMHIGIGSAPNTAKWWDGHAWQDSVCTCLITIGNRKPELFSRWETGAGFNLSYEETSIIPITNMSGRLFLEFLGTDDTRVELINGERSFDLKDFKVEYTKNDSVTKMQFPNSGWWKVQDSLDTPTMEYEAKSDSMVKQDYSVDVPYGSSDAIKASYALLINADGTWMDTAPYDGQQLRPEQHLADRIIAYWSTSKRRVECEMLTYKGTAPTIAAGITPRSLVTIDGTKMHPIAISRKWRDDVVGIHALEVSGGGGGTTYNVSCILENVTSNAPSSVDAGESLSVLLTGIDGNKVQQSSVVVLMGGTDITSTAYDHATKTISIASVTGDVSITAVGRPYDAEVEYLESDGQAYIDAGIVPTNTLGFKCKFMNSGPVDSGGYGNVFGVRNYSLTNEYQLMLFRGGQVGLGNVRNSVAMDPGVIHQIEFDGQTTVTCDGNTYTVRKDTINLSAGNTIILFAVRNAGNVAQIQAGRIYYASFGDVRDYIPVRDNGVGYLYDKVSGQLFGNAGSGAFTYGSDV